MASFQLPFSMELLPIGERIEAAVPATGGSQSET